MGLYGFISEKFILQGDNMALYFQGRLPFLGKTAEWSYNFYSCSFKNKFNEIFLWGENIKG